MTRPTHPTAPQPPRLGALISEAEPVRWITAAEYVARLRAREEGA